MYRESDDGKVVNGRTVVFLRITRSSRSSAPPPAMVARSQAAVLTSAARDGAPLCEECERARRDLEGSQE